MHCILVSLCDNVLRDPGTVLEEEEEVEEEDRQSWYGSIHQKAIVHFQVPGTIPLKTLILHTRLQTSRTLSLFVIMTS